MKNDKVIITFPGKVIDSNGAIRYGAYHEDGPSIEYANGHTFWWMNGLLHREDGPAAEYANGNKEWWLNGKNLSKEEWRQRMTKKQLGKI